MNFQHAVWIAGDTGAAAPDFRREFVLDDFIQAEITICGLGFFELYINGRRVGSDLLVPVWSNYEKRENRRLLYPLQDQFSRYRTYFLRYGVTEYLRRGPNAMGIRLGNGWYHQTRRLVEGDLDYGRPKLSLELVVTHPDGSKERIDCSEGFTVCASEILENNIFYGERHDLNKLHPGWTEPGFDSSGWQQSVQVPGPESQFCLQEAPADTVIRELTPQLIRTNGSVRLYDCGENITGYVELLCAAAPGQTITVQHSEELAPDGFSLDFNSTGKENQIQQDEYLCGFEEAVVHPWFCWHGFRYFSVDGPAQVKRVSVVHSDIPVTSSFECSDPLLTWLYQTYVRTQLNNFHCAVPSDCPHRERLGYCGDGQVTARSAMLCLAAAPLYRKWMDDITDCQDKHTGHIQHTAPFYGGGGGPGGWGGAVYLVPAAYYELTGDKGFPAKYYPNMRLWLEYMHHHCEDGLITREEEGGWCLGEWCTPGAPLIPPEFVNTYYYIKGLRTVQFFAKTLHIPEDLPLLEQRQRKSEQALIRQYFDPSTGSFCGGENGADAFALDIGLGDSRTLENLVERYQGKGTFDTGIFGTDLLVDVLFQHGYGELAYQLLTNQGEASFAAMRQAGATTLWEFWDGSDSHDHPMLGGCVRALFTHVLGIRQRPGSVGFEDVTIAPADIPGIAWARGHITTPRGEIAVHYTRGADGRIQLESPILPKEYQF